MLTKSEVDSLILLPKISQETHVDLNRHKSILNLSAQQDAKLKFKLHITISQKIKFKLHCHHDHETIGILRVDFNGGHRNPVKISKTVPEFLHKYAGTQFKRNDHHVHIYVENHGLQWAIPIRDSFITVSEINSENDTIKVINEITSYINIQTKIKYPLSVC